MTERRGIDEALELLQRAVNEKGAEYVYPDEERDGTLDEGVCMYRRADGGPSCIVGHVAGYIGVLDQMVENEPADELMSVWFTDGAASALQEAQGVQDAGSTWGRALERAQQKVSVLRKDYK